MLNLIKRFIRYIRCDVYCPLNNERLYRIWLYVWSTLDPNKLG